MMGVLMALGWLLLTLRTSHLTYGKHTVFPASRFGATTSDEVTTVPARSWRCDVR